MARDEMLFRRFIAGLTSPCLRFYQWKPPGLSIGRFQKIGEGIDLKACDDLGIRVVRRLTGGEAVLHDDELTYSIIVPLSHPSFDSIGVPDTYRTISKALIRGLELSGISASMAADGSTRPDPSGRGVCFYTPTLNEVVSDGRKIIGSAQTREKMVILQHGSIPISTDHDKLFKATGVPTERQQIFEDLFRARATDIASQSGIRPDLDSVTNNFIEGFEEVFEMETELSEYSAQEDIMTRFLVKNRYGSDDWNFKNKLRL